MKKVAVEAVKAVASFFLGTTVGRIILIVLIAALVLAACIKQVVNADTITTNMDLQKIMPVSSKSKGNSNAKPGEFPIYRQGDYSIAGFDIPGDGCGPTAMAMVLTGLGLVLDGYDANGDGVMTPDEVAQFMLDKGVLTPGDGMFFSAPRVVAESLGDKVDFVSVENPDDKAAAANEAFSYIKSGYVGTVANGAGFFTSVGHITAAVGWGTVDNSAEGQTSEEGIKIQDPNGGRCNDGTFSLGFLASQGNSTRYNLFKLK